MAESTFFASPARLSAEEAREESRAVQGYADLRILLEAIPDCAAVLNEHRQILLANDELFELLSLRDLDEILGTRPGEAIGCLRSWEAPSGCGTGEACRYCGAANALVQALESGEKATHECRITVETETETKWLDLLVTAKPLEVEGRRLVLLTLADISDAKRRRVLERTFFHDVLNSASALYGMLQMLHDFEEGDVREELGHLTGLCERLIDEITSQRDLLSAESGELNVQPRPVDIEELLLEAALQFKRMAMDQGVKLEVGREYGTVEVVTDRRLLFRVITNMVKNAIEATSEGGVVACGFDAAAGGVRIWVRNPDEMTREVQLQVFQRSFSTRGAGRGIGTYSMKLIGERYLGGEVSFETGDGEGTEFSIKLPAALHEA